MSKHLKTSTRYVRRVLLFVWALIIVLAVGWFITDPSRFSAQHIAGFLTRFHGWIWAIYILFSVLRGLTLLPSTPLVLAGTILFPDQPFTVLFVSILGILLSSSMIYFFSEHLGFSKYFESRKPALTHRIKAKLEHPLGFLFVAGWAFFPFVPTDLVCYVAGATRMNFWKFIAAVFAGELILCICYVFFGGSLLKSVR